MPTVSKFSRAKMRSNKRKAEKQSRVKAKTHKAATKRMKLTADGHVRRRKAGIGHLCSHKTRNRKRRLRKPGLVHISIEQTYRRLLGGK